MGPSRLKDWPPSDGLQSDDDWDQIHHELLSPNADAISSGLQRVRDQCKDARNFPKNIVKQGYAKYQVELKYNRLQDESFRLFCTSDQASIVFHEFSANAAGMRKGSPLLRHHHLAME